MKTPVVKTRFVWKSPDGKEVELPEKVRLLTQFLDESNWPPDTVPPELINAVREELAKIKRQYN